MSVSQKEASIFNFILFFTFVALLLTSLGYLLLLYVPVVVFVSLYVRKSLVRICEAKLEKFKYKSIFHDDVFRPISFLRGITDELTTRPVSEVAAVIAGFVIVIPFVGCYEFMRIRAEEARG